MVYFVNFCSHLYSFSFHGVYFFNLLLWKISNNQPNWRKYAMNTHTPTIHILPLTFDYNDLFVSLWTEDWCLSWTVRNWHYPFTYCFSIFFPIISFCNADWTNVWPSRTIFHFSTLFMFLSPCPDLSVTSKLYSSSLNYSLGSVCLTHPLTF